MALVHVAAGEFAGIEGGAGAAAATDPRTAGDQVAGRVDVDAPQRTPVRFVEVHLGGGRRLARQRLFGFEEDPREVGRGAAERAVETGRVRQQRAVADPFAGAARVDPVDVAVAGFDEVEVGGLVERVKRVPAADQDLREVAGGRHHHRLVVGARDAAAGQRVERGLRPAAGAAPRHPFGGDARLRVAEGVQRAVDDAVAVGADREGLFDPVAVHVDRRDHLVGAAVGQLRRLRPEGFVRAAGGAGRGRRHEGERQQRQARRGKCAQAIESSIRCRMRGGRVVHRLSFPAAIPGRRRARPYHRSVSHKRRSSPNDKSYLSRLKGQRDRTEDAGAVAELRGDQVVVDARAELRGVEVGGENPR